MLSILASLQHFLCFFCSLGRFWYHSCSWQGRFWRSLLSHATRNTWSSSTVFTWLKYSSALSSSYENFQLLCTQTVRGLPIILTAFFQFSRNWCCSRGTTRRRMLELGGATEQSKNSLINQSESQVYFFVAPLNSSILRRLYLCRYVWGSKEFQGRAFAERQLSRQSHQSSHQTRAAWEAAVLGAPIDGTGHQLAALSAISSWDTRRNAYPIRAITGSLTAWCPQQARLDARQWTGRALRG